MSETNMFSHVNVRVAASLKDAAYAQIKELGMTPTEVFKDVLEYIVREGKMPVRKQILSDEDAELLALVKERLANPGKKIRVDLDDLSKRLHIEIP